MTFVHRAFAILGLLAAASSATAQVVVEQIDAGGRRAGIRPDGLVVEAGLAAPVHGDNTALVGVSVGMGTLLSRHLDFSIDIRRWSSDLDLSDFGSTVDGSFSDLSLGMSLKLPLMKIAGLRPYLATGLAGHVVGADVPGDRSLEDALSGLNTGAHAAFGLATTAKGLGMRVQARRDFVDDVGAWTVTAGFGWWPKRRAAPAVNRYGTTPRVTTYTSTPALVTTEGGPTIRDLTIALNHLKAENRRLEDEITEIRTAVARLAANPTTATTPAAPPVNSTETQPDSRALLVARLDERPNRADDLFGSLERVAALSGNPSALKRDGDSGLLTLDQTLLFASGQSELMVEAREELRRFAVVLLRFPESGIVVQGHTDATGRSSWNLTLSEKRALAVRDELVRLGVDPVQVSAVGFGSSRPIDGNDTPEGRSRNRRVDLLVTLNDVR